MGNSLKVGILVELLVLVIAIAFSVFYFSQGYHLINHGYDVLLVMLWVLVAALLLFLLRSRSLLHEEMRRRFYLSHDWIYNHEIGYAPVSKVMGEGNAYDFVAFAADSLAFMSYGFEVAETPENFKAEYVVSSRRFRFHKTEDGVVIDQWQGALQKVERSENSTDFTLVTVGAFSNANQLARLIEDCEVLDGPFDLQGGE